MLPYVMTGVVVAAGLRGLWLCQWTDEELVLIDQIFVKIFTCKFKKEE